MNGLASIPISIMAGIVYRTAVSNGPELLAACIKNVFITENIVAKRKSSTATPTRFGIVN